MAPHRGAVFKRHPAQMWAPEGDIKYERDIFLINKMAQYPNEGNTTFSFSSSRHALSRRYTQSKGYHNFKGHFLLHSPSPTLQSGPQILPLLCLPYYLDRSGQSLHCILFEGQSFIDVPTFGSVAAQQLVGGLVVVTDLKDLFAGEQQYDQGFAS